MATLINRKNWLGSEVGLVRKTITVPKTLETEKVETIMDADGFPHRIVPSGTLINDENLGKGLLFEDVDITGGDQLGSLVIRGSYIEANLPKSVASDKTELAAKGLYEISYAPTVRPDFGTSGLAKINKPVATASGKTISWTKVDGAIGYAVYDVDKSEIKTVTDLTFTVPSAGTYYVKAIADNVYKANSDFTEVKVTA